MVVLKGVFFCSHLSLFFLTGMMCIVVGFDSIEDVILQPNLVLCFSECCDYLGFFLNMCMCIFSPSRLNFNSFNFSNPLNLQNSLSFYSSEEYAWKKFSVSLVHITRGAFVFKVSYLRVIEVQFCCVDMTWFLSGLVSFS